MALPVFRSSRIRRNAKSQQRSSAIDPSDKSARSPSSRAQGMREREDAVRESKNVKRRRYAIIVSCSLLLISVVMLLLVMIGNISNKPVIRQTYLFKLNLANILPAGIEDIEFVNSIARSLGLHDFYQVGLWNFCEGYDDEGITHCSTPQNLYWFNPVQILLSELLSGASIALPSQINTILTLIRIASQIMFAFFLTSLCGSFLLLFVSPVTLSPSLSPLHRFLNIFINLLLTLEALLVLVASIIGTAMAVIFKVVITSQTELNIGASLGIRMLVFMWIATACIVLAWIIHLGMSCCCLGRRNGCCGIPCCGGSYRRYDDVDLDAENARVADEKTAEARRKAAAGERGQPESADTSAIEGA